ncbi:hypothetical protein [Flavivirga rizhaonensis]|uniref:Uncharacterized protein n=1 Tax=Flavivirga rizhaonensis TaxID=2559571 RepID=A0A4S1DZ81_9FLAO|nr:hypothetical protein [Flavivirga rizhaonensis]TGV03631.1 hypothetical protein EM932_06290 [Flavivirga rizhaonensis]
MITGETEAIIQRQLGEEDYDEFFGSRKKRKARRAKRAAKKVERRSAPKRIERKAKRKVFFSKLGQAYQGLGGATALGAAIDTITKPTTVSKYPLTNNEVSEDYSISVGASNDDPLPDKKQFPIKYIIVGSVVFIGIIGVIVYANKKKKLRMQQYR